MVKVLIHVPIYNNYSKFWESLWELDIEGLEVDYYFTKTDKVKTRINPDGNYNVNDITINLTYKMEKARKVVLSGGYDYLFNLEDDHIIPKDALKQLLKWKKDAISGVYRLRPSKNKQTPIAAIIAKTRKWVTKEDLEKSPLIKCSLIPWGCVLFSRKALEAASFEGSLDGPYATKLAKAGIETWLATDVRVGHIDRDGVIVWP